jgi:putative membrane protein
MIPADGRASPDHPPVLDGEKRTMLTIRISRVVAVAAVAAASTLSVTSPVSAQAAKLDDPTIVAIFDAANTWDVETGQIAVKKGSNKEVRDFGAMLARDHKMVRQQGRDLAKKLQVTPTPPKDFAMAKDHAAAVRKLNSLSGKDFDKAFLQHEVDYHKAVIDAVTTTLLPALQNQEVKDLVTKVAPAFTAHMQAAQSLLNKQSAAN